MTLNLFDGLGQRRTTGSIRQVLLVAHGIVHGALIAGTSCGIPTGDAPAQLTDPCIKPGLAQRRRDAIKAHPGVDGIDHRGEHIHAAVDTHSNVVANICGHGHKAQIRVHKR